MNSSTNLWSPLLPPSPPPRLYLPVSSVFSAPPPPPVAPPSPTGAISLPLSAKMKPSRSSPPSFPLHSRSPHTFLAPPSGSDPPRSLLPPRPVGSAVLLLQFMGSLQQLPHGRRWEEGMARENRGGAAAAGAGKRRDGRGRWREGREGEKRAARDKGLFRGTKAIT